MRIISLVPSLTELLIDLNLQQELVGRTKFCIHPKEKIKSIPKIGGTKAVNISAVADLNPDLIIANKEENTKKDIEALRNFAPVHLTDISNYNEALLAISDIGKLTNRNKESKQLIEAIESGFSKLTKNSFEVKSVCYLIWQNPLMTVGRDTFIHDMLDRCGFRNVFGDQDRYPTITVGNIEEKEPDYVFLSSEPFPFKQKHLRDYQEICPASKVVIVDGEYFSWYGSRMVLAAKYFGELRNEFAKF